MTVAYIPVRAETPDPEVKVQPWGTEITLAETPTYTLKRLDYKAGMAGGLQLHTEKIESFHIFHGAALVTIDDGKGALLHIPVGPGATFHIPAGAAHKFYAITDCTVFEASTNVKDDRVRLERYFGMGEPEGLPSTHAEPTR